MLSHGTRGIIKGYKWGKEKVKKTALLRRNSIAPKGVRSGSGEEGFELQSQGRPSVSHAGSVQGLGINVNVNNRARNEELISGTTQAILVMVGIILLVPSFIYYVVFDRNLAVTGTDQAALDLLRLVAGSVILPSIIYSRNESLRSHVRVHFIEASQNMKVYFHELFRS